VCQRILKRKRCVYNTGRSCQAHISCRLVGHTTDSSPTPTSSSLTGSCSDFQEAAQACYNDLGDMSDSIGNITLKTNRCVLSRKLSEITHLGNHFFFSDTTKHILAQPFRHQTMSVCKNENYSCSMHAMLRACIFFQLWSAQGEVKTRGLWKFLEIA